MESKQIEEIKEPPKKKLKPISESKNGTGMTDLQGCEGEELATFGAGCYWGTEKYYAVNFAKKNPGAILG
jgi:hypothetical protein